MPFLCSPRFSFAEEKAQARSDSVNLNQIPELLQKSDLELKIRAEALVTAVESEVTARRMPPMIVQNLRNAVKNADFDNGLNARTLLSNAVLPMDNEAIANAANAFQQIGDLLQHQRAADFRICLTAVTEQISETIHNAKSSKEIAPLIRTVELLPEWAAHHSLSGEISPQTLSSLAKCGEFLRSLSKVADLRPSDDPTSVARALRSIDSLGQSFGDFVSETDIHTRKSSVLAPLKDGAAQAENHYEAALIGRKPVAEIQAAFSSFEEASKKYAAVAVALDGSRRGQDRDKLAAYQELSTIAGDIEAGQWKLVPQQIESVSKSLDLLSTPPPAELLGLVEQWKHELRKREQDEKAAAAAPERQENERLSAKLAAIQKPADATAFAAELSSQLPNAVSPRQEGVARELARRLTALASAWESSEARNVASPRSPRYEQAPSPLGREWAELQGRVSRQLLSKSLQAPELNQPPWAAQPDDNAVESFSEKLAAEGQWQRLRGLFEARERMLSPAGAPPREPEAIASIRAYLAGQNFELAAQWTDAALSYKTVLMNAVEHSPIAEAAARLKSLAKEHPSEVKAARISPQPDFYRGSLKPKSL